MFFLQARRTKHFSRSDFEMNTGETDDSPKNEAQSLRLSSTVEEEEEDKSSATVSCKCKGDCGTKRCMCKKAGYSCKDSCKCRSEKCSNREPELPQSTTNDAELEKHQENVRNTILYVFFTSSIV